MAVSRRGHGRSNAAGFDGEVLLLQSWMGFQLLTVYCFRSRAARRRRCGSSSAGAAARAEEDGEDEEATAAEAEEMAETRKMLPESLGKMPARWVVVEQDQRRRCHCFDGGGVVGVHRGLVDLDPLVVVVLLVGSDRRIVPSLEQLLLAAMPAGLGKTMEHRISMLRRRDKKIEKLLSLFLFLFLMLISILPPNSSAFSHQ
ncbi:hypothetical protein ACLOJK_003658 [Asimina triloba]